MFKKLLNNLSSQRMADKQAALYRDFLRHEARIGGEIFGPVQKGCRREFFCLDRHTWVWHEEWVDQNGQYQTTTTRYDVRPNGIIKSQNGQYQQVTREEALRLYEAAKLYDYRIRNEVYAFAI
jgi:hypothetical protein